MSLRCTTATFFTPMSNRRILQSIINRQDAGRTLLDWLVSRFRYLDVEQWTAEIREGRVRVNGRRSDGGHELQSGDCVIFEPEDLHEPEVNKDYSFVYRDDDFALINKPANLPSHPGGIYRENSLWSLLVGKYPTATLVNRLDRETSGIILVALSDKGRKALDIQLGNSALEKEYLVLVHGDTPGQFRADGWISHDNKSEIRKKRKFYLSFPDGAKAQSCSTGFFKVAGNRDLSLLRATLGSGRTHQIRASLFSLGFPVLGDKIYGLDELLFIRLSEGRLDEDDLRTLVLSHQALHSVKLTISFKSHSPIRPGESLEFFAPLPADFAAVVNERLSTDLHSLDGVKALWQ